MNEKTKLNDFRFVEDLLNRAGTNPEVLMDDQNFNRFRLVVMGYVYNHDYNELVFIVSKLFPILILPEFPNTYDNYTVKKSAELDLLYDMVNFVIRKMDREYEDSTIKNMEGAADVLGTFFEKNVKEISIIELRRNFPGSLRELFNIIEVLKKDGYVRRFQKNTYGAGFVGLEPLAERWWKMFQQKK